MIRLHVLMSEMELLEDLPEKVRTHLEPYVHDKEFVISQINMYVGYVRNIVDCYVTGQHMTFRGYLGERNQRDINEKIFEIYTEECIKQGWLIRS